jgi:hypothetical protein
MSPDDYHADLRARSLAALRSQAFRSDLDALHARCVAYAARRAIPVRRTDEQFDADVERAEGGPDVIRNAFA